MGERLCKIPEDSEDEQPEIPGRRTAPEERATLDLFAAY
jgi:hypothetical protein